MLPVHVVHHNPGARRREQPIFPLELSRFWTS
jgi:hypothetical protein